MLYIVPTPIGNLDDITLRAINVLKEVDYIIAEDTRHSGHLLKHLQISKPLRSFHAHNEHYVLNKVIEDLSIGINIAQISDAGTPGISDPGYLLSKACFENDIEVICLPGATAFVPALLKSGMPCDKFYFEGFLPAKKGRKTRFEYLTTLQTTLILYESPHKLLKTIEEISQYFGNETLIAVVKEISKINETLMRNTAFSLLLKLKSLPSIKGEYVILIDNRPIKTIQTINNDD